MTAPASGVASPRTSLEGQFVGAWAGAFAMLVRTAALQGAAD